tara:strand:+ start:1076 stop:1732 length:657 start_codon:yes stop_codon:yes gene_type:complete
MKKKILPSISVIVSLYNHEKWIERCLRSLINQKIIKKNSFEIIVVNDNSKDGSLKILSKFKKINNIRIINNKKNLGLPKSLNKALKVSYGKYIVRVDSDDYVNEYFLFLMKIFLDLNKKYQAVEVDYLKVNDKEKIISYNNASKNNIACGIMFRKECIFDIGLYNKNFKMREGHELRKRFMKIYKIARIELPLYKYRMHSKNRTKLSHKLKIYDKLLK